MQQDWTAVEIYTDTGVMSETRVREQLAAGRGAGKKAFLQLNPAFFPGLAGKCGRKPGHFRDKGSLTRSSHLALAELMVSVHFGQSKQDLI